MLSDMRVLAGILLAALLVIIGQSPPAPAAMSVTPTATDGWHWPVDPARIVSPYRAPAHRYAAGHRGIDLAASPGAVVSAPAAGTVAFAGDVAGRPLVTIDHGDGLVSTLEPVIARVPIGAHIRAGDAVGAAATGGHARAGAVHFGVREDGEYINPMALLTGVPRAILLPCC